MTVANLYFSDIDLVNVAFVTFVGLQFFDVLVGLLFQFAAFFLNDFAQRRIHILGHTSRVAANEEVASAVVTDCESRTNFHGALRGRGFGIAFRLL